VHDELERIWWEAALPRDTSNNFGIAHILTKIRTGSLLNTVQELYSLSAFSRRILAEYWKVHGLRLAERSVKGSFDLSRVSV
jgi:hypothetical protein